jgi:hypothetical protein
MYRLTKYFALIFLAVILSSCATGPKYSAIKSSLPKLNLEDGRIYFYRTANPFGSAIQPDVNLNGEKVGRSIPGGLFFLDCPPGNYEVVLSTEVVRKLTFTLDKRQTRYVRMSVTLGVIIYRVFPTLVDESKALSEMEGLSYTGTKVKKE